MFSYMWLTHTHTHTQAHLHDGSVLPDAKWQLVHLGNEDGAHGDEERRAVHVDCGANGQHESGDARVHAALVVHAAEGDRQRGRPVEGVRVSGRATLAGCCSNGRE